MNQQQAPAIGYTKVERLKLIAICKEESQDCHHTWSELFEAARAHSIALPDARGWLRNAISKAKMSGEPLGQN
jgi:hypothetical protein